MIIWRSSLQDLGSLAGRIIFHPSKGGHISLVEVLPSSSTVGARIGKVTSVSSQYRIFYIAAEYSEKWVNIADIGYICDTNEEAEALDAIRNAAHEHARSSVDSIRLEVKRRIDELNA